MTDSNRTVVPQDASQVSRVGGFDLSERVTLDTLRALQDRFSALGKVTVCICTAGGEPILKPTWGSQFSKLIGTSSGGWEAFSRNVRRCALQVRSGADAICEDAMTYYAALILHDDRQLGTIVVGTRGADSLEPETLEGFARRYGLAMEEMVRRSLEVDPYLGGTPEAIHDFADALADTIACLYGQADRIHQQLNDLQAVHSFTELLSGPLGLQEILDLTVIRVIEVLPVKACAIRMLNPDTGELVIKAVANLSEEYLQKGPVLLAENEIDSQAFGGETVYIADAPNDPRLRYPENARREGIVSGLCVPMKYRGQGVGVLRVYTDRSYTFSLGEQSLLRSIGAQAAAAIITSQLHHEHAANEQVQRQVRSAGEVQRRMLPAHTPKIPGVEIGFVHEPSLQLSGDFYDFIELAGGQLGICIADVVGKGLPAALTMASVRSAVRGYAGREEEPGAVIALANDHMVLDTPVGEFTTLVYGVISADGGTFRYCNAGHESPQLLRGYRFRELTAGGMVIGVQSGEVFSTESQSLEPGDVLVLTTDGVSEAMDFDGKMYGRQRVLDSILKHRDADAQTLARQMLWDVRRFAGLAEQSDDITIITLKVVGEASGNRCV